MHEHESEGHRGAPDLLQPATAQDPPKHSTSTWSAGMRSSPPLPKDIVIQSWRGFDHSLQAPAGLQRHPLAPYYLDGMKIRRRTLPRRSHPRQYRPHARTAEAHPRRRGLHVGRTFDPSTIDSRIWPRTAPSPSASGRREPVTMSTTCTAASPSLHSTRILGLTHLSKRRQLREPRRNAAYLDALRTFASVLEPVSFHARYDQQTTSQLTVPQPLRRRRASRSAFAQ